MKVFLVNEPQQREEDSTVNICKNLNAFNVKAESSRLTSLLSCVWPTGCCWPSETCSVHLSSAWDERGTHSRKVEFPSTPYTTFTSTESESDKDTGQPVGHCSFAFTALHTVWCSQGNDGNDSFPFVVMFVWMWDGTGDKRLYRKKHFFCIELKWKISLTVKKISFPLFLTTKQRKPQLCDTSTRGRHMLVFRTPW